jgi:hypothetical protein
MTTVPYSETLPSSFDIARRDDFFGFGNAMQAIESITPNYANPDGTVRQPSQVVTMVNGGAVPSELPVASSGGTFFDLRSPEDIFADMDAQLNRQRQHVLDSPATLRMLEQR